MSQACTVNAMVGVRAGDGGELRVSDWPGGIPSTPPPRHPRLSHAPPPGPQGQGICLYHFKPPLKIPICPSPLQPRPWVVGPAEGLSSAQVDGASGLSWVKAWMRK